MFRRFFTTVQDIISDIIDGGGKDSSAHTGELISGTHNASGPRSVPSSPQDSVFPQIEVYHALLIFHEDDQDKAQNLLDKLNQIVLKNGQRARVAMEDDLVSAGQPETEAFNSYFRKNALFFLFITESFVKSNIYKWKSDVGLTVSLTYGSEMDRERFVVPIFTEDKAKAPYLMNDHILQSLTGIKYHECNWTELTRKSFVRNFESADKRIALMREGSSVD